MTELIRHSYGKDGVRLVKVVAHGAQHTVHDLTDPDLARGRLLGRLPRGRQQHELPTDTMRSTCYVVAQDTSLVDIERYAEAVLPGCCQVVPACTTAHASVVEHCWTRLAPDGVDHPHAFRGAAGVGTARCR